MDAIQALSFSSVNVANRINPFMMMNNAYEWTVSSGSGVAESVDDNFLFGKRSLFIESEDGLGIACNAVTSTRTVIEASGVYFLCWSTYSPQGSVESKGLVNLDIAKNDESWNTYTVWATPFDEWCHWFAVLNLSEGDILDFSFQMEPNNDYTTAHRCYIDGFGLYLNNAGLDLPPSFAEPFTDVPTAIGLEAATYGLDVNVDGDKDWTDLSST